MVTFRKLELIDSMAFVQCIVVKDFRNYIEMGTYLEQISPFLGVRFISISDQYDSKDYKGKSSDSEVQFK